MLSMQFVAGEKTLRRVELPEPVPSAGEIRLKVAACGVCRTDLHIVDGDLPPLREAITPGHEIIGRVDAIGPGVEGVRIGDRLGATWLGGACGRCAYCLEGAENLCRSPVFTGWSRDGGYAEAVIVDARFAFPIPDSFSDLEAAPLMCAGLIGFRSWRKACEHRPVRRLGLYGFGAAAHLLAQLARRHGQEVYAFCRPGDEAALRLALDLGCAWAGASTEPPPAELDAAILFAPVGDLVPLALQAVRPGGIVVCGGIHMSDIPAFPYRLLWEERRLVSVANLTREDGRDYLPLAAAARVKPHVVPYRLEQANEALQALRAGQLAGAAILHMTAGEPGAPQ